MSCFSATAKLSRYSVDGKGRDSYILSNNGGMYKKFTARVTDMFQSGSFKAKHQSRVIAPEVTPKTVWYRGDGTGRDTYAIDQQLALPRRKNYLRNLRLYDHNPEASLSLSTSQKLTPYQQKSIRRLSKPKINEDPYQNLRRSFRVSVDHSWRKPQ